MWTQWISNPPSSLGNPPHRVVTLGEIRNFIRIRYPGSIGLLLGVAEGSRKPCIEPAGDARYLYDF